MTFRCGRLGHANYVLRLLGIWTFGHLDFYAPEVKKLVFQIFFLIFYKKFFNEKFFPEKVFYPEKIVWKKVFQKIFILLSKKKKLLLKRMKIFWKTFFQTIFSG